MGRQFTGQQYGQDSTSHQYHQLHRVDQTDGEIQWTGSSRLTIGQVQGQYTQKRHPSKKVRFATPLTKQEVAFEAARATVLAGKPKCEMVGRVRVRAHRASTIKRYKGNVQTDQLGQVDDDHADPMIRCWAAKVSNESRLPRSFKEAMKHQHHADFMKAAAASMTCSRRKGSGNMPGGAKCQMG